MISVRKHRANRANARASTGPRTAAGKASSARNAHRHGLNVSVMADLSLAAEVAALAREIVGEATTPELPELAARIAEAQIDLVRVRRARRDLLSQAFAGSDGGSPAAVASKTAELAKDVAILADLPPLLAAMDRYERRAWSRRKLAIRAFDAARTA